MNILRINCKPSQGFMDNDDNFTFKNTCVSVLMQYLLKSHDIICGTSIENTTFSSLICEDK